MSPPPNIFAYFFFFLSFFVQALRPNVLEESGKGGTGSRSIYRSVMRLSMRTGVFLRLLRWEEEEEEEDRPFSQRLSS